jgi:hypothetical protein
MEKERGQIMCNLMAYREKAKTGKWRGWKEN